MGIIGLKVRGLAVAAVSIASVAPVARAQAPVAPPVAAERKEAPAPRFPMPQGPRVTSPEVAADGRVTFRILAPKAQAVRLLGDIPSEGPTVPMQPPTGRALTQGAEGVWEATVGPRRAGRLSLQLQRGRRVGHRPAQPRRPASRTRTPGAWSIVPGLGASDTKDVPHGAVADGHLLLAAP